MKAIAFIGACGEGRRGNTPRAIGGSVSLTESATISIPLFVNSSVRIRGGRNRAAWSRVIQLGRIKKHVVKERDYVSDLIKIGRFMSSTPIALAGSA
jgi:hypothetical protein